MGLGNCFKGRQFTAEVILWAVRWYLMFPVSYRDLELMLLDRGVEVDHSSGDLLRPIGLDRVKSAGSVRGVSMKSEANALPKAASHLTQSPGDTISCCAEERAQREELQMPIRRYVDEGVFSSEALSAMGKALEATTETLGMATTKHNVEPSRSSLSGWHRRTTASMQPRCVIGRSGVGRCRILRPSRDRSALDIPASTE